MLHGIDEYALAVGAVSLIACACARANPEQTGVTGTVSVSPARPGPQRAGETGTAPLRGAVVQLHDAQGKVVARAVADTQGQFSVLVPAGNYEINVDRQGAVFPRCKSVDATVSIGQLARVDIVCDSGMR